jgi:hypothetical protein
LRGMFRRIRFGRPSRYSCLALCGRAGTGRRPTAGRCRIEKWMGGRKLGVARRKAGEYIVGQTWSGVHRDHNTRRNQTDLNGYAA